MILFSTQSTGRFSVVLICWLCVSSTSSFAQSDQVEWENAFRLQFNPLIEVAFNPQPEPPEAGRTELSLSDPFRPELVVAESGVSDGQMRILFAIQSDYEITFPEDAPEAGTFDFQLVGSESDYLVEFELLTESGGIPDEASWVSFNPQPEPPEGLGANPNAVGFDFTFTSNSPATMRLQIFDSVGNPVRFTAVPEPSAVIMTGLCICVLSIMRRNARLCLPSYRLR